MPWLTWLSGLSLRVLIQAVVVGELTFRGFYAKSDGLWSIGFSCYWRSIIRSDASSISVGLPAAMFRLSCITGHHPQYPLFFFTVIYFAELSPPYEAFKATTKLYGYVHTQEPTSKLPTIQYTNTLATTTSTNLELFVKCPIIADPRNINHSTVPPCSGLCKSMKIVQIPQVRNLCRSRSDRLHRFSCPLDNCCIRILESWSSALQKVQIGCRKTE